MSKKQEENWYGRQVRTADIIVDGEKNLEDKSYKAWFLTGLQP